jgi:DNA polymerase alpha subunit B
MADLNDLFAPSSALSPDIMGELESMLRLYSISPQELFYKWESYSLKMGSEDTKLNLETVRMFKKDVQDGLERDTHGRHVGRGSERKSSVAATPRGATSGGDVFGMQVCVIQLPLLVANVRL